MSRALCVFEETLAASRAIYHKHMELMGTTCGHTRGVTQRDWGLRSYTDEQT